MKGFSTERWHRVDALLVAALERSSAEREGFLDEISREDPELGRELRQLVDDTTAAEAALGESVSEYAEAFVAGLRETLRTEDAGGSPGGVPAGVHIGPYRIRGELGRGGMGAVYLAERADAQFERQVAVKLVKRGMDTDAVLRRFRYERQILAGLEHPHIARLYDGGATEDGRPYLVMEHIEGRPVTAYCDEQRLTIEARLRLFETICDAVQFAHRNLVIHRDIKPSNILVGADGTVKLLDFGIAKLLDPSAADAALQTRTEMQMLTPEYASPEQLDGRPVTTASDVYALGVVLYELLSGRRPREHLSRAARLQDRAVGSAAIERASSVVMRAPSRRPGAPAPPTPEEIAARRGTTPQRLRRRLRGELDTIASKALAEEPDRRYQSAEQLLADVHRFRNGRPVLARGESALYRARKFVRRHRLAAGFSAALGILAVAFAATSLLQAQEVARARAVAERRQAQAENLIGFMLGDLRGKLMPIGRLDVLEDVGNHALAYFAAVPADRLSDSELFRRSEALRLLGEVQRDQGDLETAAGTFRESLELAEGLARRDSLHGTWQIGLAASHFYLGQLRYVQNDPGGALEHWRAYHQIAERLVRQAPDSLTYRLELSYAHSNLGSAFQAMGDRERALQQYLLTLEQKRKLVDLAPDNVTFQSALAIAYNKVAVLQTLQGELRGALENHRAELAVQQAVVARDTTDAEALRRLSVAHNYLGELLAAVMPEGAEGLEHQLAAWELHQALVARDPRNVLWQRGLSISARLAGLGLVQNGRPGAGVDALESSRTLMLELFASDSQSIDYRQELAKTETTLAAAYRLANRPDLAEAAARRSLVVIDPVRAARPDHPASRRIESDAALELGRALARIGRAAEARDAWQRALDTIRPVVQASGSNSDLVTFCFALLFLERLDEARPVMDTLLRRGYRRADFVALARENGMLPSDGRSPRGARQP